MWILLIKRYTPYLVIALAFGAVTIKCWYLDNALTSERARNQAYRAQQEALVKLQKQQNAEALDFALDFSLAKEKEDKAKLDNVLTQLNKTVNLNEELNDALTLSRTNVERLREYVRSDYANRGTPETVEHSEGGRECNGTNPEDIRNLIAAAAKTTIDFNACKRREELVCGGRFPVKCSGKMP